MVLKIRTNFLANPTQIHVVVTINNNIVLILLKCNSSIVITQGKKVAHSHRVITMSQALWSWLCFHSLIYKTGRKTKKFKKGPTASERARGSPEAQGPGHALGQLDPL